MLKGELANENGREEPACLKCSKGLVPVNSWSSSACVEGRARQSENSEEEPVCLKFSEVLAPANM